MTDDGEVEVASGMRATRETRWTMRACREFLDDGGQNWEVVVSDSAQPSSLASNSEIT